MSDVPTEIVCENCGNAGGNQPAYCEECGAEDPWTEEVLYDFDDVELPMTFSYEVYDDNYGLWDTFCRAAFGTELKSSQIANFPETFPRMKYCMPILHFKLTEEYELKGPYLDKQGARNA